MAAWRDPIVGHVDDILTRAANVLGHRLEAVTELEGEPEAGVAAQREPVSAPGTSEAPSPSDINDLTADLSTIHDELRDLYQTPPLISRARRYERVAILHEQAGRAARGLVVAWEHYERSKA